MLLNILIVIVLLSLAGIFAGLTLALFSIKISTLEQKMRLGDAQAAKVYKIRVKGNQLLCTLLLANVASYTAMAIFLDSLTTGLIAGLIATSLIFVFGEIVPQAVFPRHAMALGAAFSGILRVLLVVFYPLSAPIAWVLDKLLGTEAPLLWSKEELQEIIKYHEDVGDGIIDQDEERIILGALSFSDKTVDQIMIPVQETFYLEVATVLDKDVMATVKSEGHSRIPVLDRPGGKVLGILYLKDLLALPDERETAGTLCRPSHVISVNMHTRLDSLLDLLVRRKIHMAVVLDDYGKLAGVATMEDIMEEILITELEDRKP